MSSFRVSIVRFFAVARGEARIASAGAPQVAWRLLGLAGWTVAAILSGLLVGVVAVALPPMGLAGVVGIFGLALLWVLPDGLTPPDRFIRLNLLIVVFADICIPTYYSLQVPGLPWISVRRVVTFVLIFMFSIAFSTSRSSRARIFSVVNDNKLIFVGVFGFLITIVASIFTSITPFGSLNGLVSALLEWYVPFICAIYVLRDVKDVEMMIRFICWCAIGLMLVAAVEFVTGKSLYISIMPRFMYDQMIANSDYARDVLTSGFHNRMGQVRVNGPYSVSLSFAEFQAMVAPFGAAFLLHGRNMFDRVFGIAVLLACLIAIYMSGSRGGYLSFLVGNFMFVMLFVVRSRLLQPRSLIAPLFGILGGAAFVVVAVAIAFVGRVHNVIFASGEGDSSNQARLLQWTLAWPKIVANPVTGHGFAAGGEIVGYRASAAAPLSVDSFLLSLLVETGLPSVILYFGTSLVSTFVGVKQYFLDQGRGGVLAGGLACSITGFTAYRFFLSQRENQTLLFILVGCVAIVRHLYVEERAARTPAG